MALRTGMFGVDVYLYPDGLRVATPEEIERWAFEREMYDQNVRLFVALFSYNPAMMSPNPDTMEEELPFEQGQVIKIYGDKDADGFYSGESGGHFGFVPSNMVSEIPVEDEELKQYLLQQGYLQEETDSLETSESSCVTDSLKVHRMVAIFDYDPWESSPNMDFEAELPFRAGDIIYVFGEMDRDGFYCGDLHGYQGLVPSNFLQPLPWD
ncbi:RIMS-binding protein 2-like [Triplophysa dalaica]|uniref:RIMS-binding protein 2-like n=1 Tax=Triplophysa dalaica TaxID=1582913 RepID=UPI0024DF5985|nr:RIMS-binding protein 2-like [Triplophysa dalaica]